MVVSIILLCNKLCLYNACIYWTSYLLCIQFEVNNQWMVWKVPSVSKNVRFRNFFLKGEHFFVTYGSFLVQLIKTRLILNFHLSVLDVCCYSLTYQISTIVWPFWSVFFVHKTANKSKQQWSGSKNSAQRPVVKVAVKTFGRSSETHSRYWNNVSCFLECFFL